jgi:hypothetical protein
MKLANAFSNQLGMLPTPALAHYAQMGGVHRIYENAEPAGMVVGTLSMKGKPRTASIIQAAVQMDAQRRTHGATLVRHFEVLARLAGARAAICWCAADLEANSFWLACGWTLFGHRRGGNARGRLLNRWTLCLTQDVTNDDLAEIPGHGPGGRFTKKSKSTEICPEQTTFLIPD